MAEGQQVPLDTRKDWNKDRNRETTSRAVREYLDTFNEAAFGAASEVTPKFGSPSNPAAQCTVGRVAFLEEGERTPPAPADPGRGGAPGLDPRCPVTSSAANLPASRTEETA
jgi:hypothetical protein